MAKQHATALESELRELSEQLTTIEPANSQPSAAVRDSIQIDTSANFAQAARELLRQTRILNRRIGNAFTAGSTGKEAENHDSLIVGAIHSIPEGGAAEMAAFATRLSNSENAATSPTKRAGKE
jgi:hypothetical protein